METKPPLAPRKIDQISPTEITILWSDGRLTRHTFRRLRYLCQCAYCRDEHTGVRTITWESIPESMKAVRIEPVGSYALKFVWSDGHQTGFYTYPYLRENDETEKS